MNRLIEYLRVPRHLALALAAVSAAALASAYISQYGFGLKPCNLCLYQRIPYSLNIVSGILAFLATFRYPRLAALLLFLSAVAFFLGAGIAGFHAGVEYGWWEGLDSCAGSLPENATAEELRKYIMSQNVVRCDKPQWALFGISMAGYNFALSLALSVIMIYLLRRRTP